MTHSFSQPHVSEPENCGSSAVSATDPVAIWHINLNGWMTLHEVPPCFAIKIVRSAPPNLMIEATRQDPKVKTECAFSPIGDEEHPAFFESWVQVMKMHEAGYFEFPVGVRPSEIDGAQVFDFLPSYTLPTYTLPNRGGAIYEPHLMLLLRWIASGGALTPLSEAAKPL